MSGENVSNPNKDLMKYINIFCDEITKETYLKQRYLNDELEIRFEVTGDILLLEIILKIQYVKLNLQDGNYSVTMKKIF